MAPMGEPSRSRHSLRHTQSLPADIEPAPPDSFFVQGQLLKTICATLAVVGFDSVKPSALESLRAEIEEYMLHFSGIVHASMIHARRTTPTPQDFIAALAENGLTSGDLAPHLDVDFPTSVASPHISPPPPAEAQPPKLAPMLGSELVLGNNPATAYIPSHFLPLPSKHTWQDTSVFSSRETDPRQIRERATQEGVLAEQALRRLTSANRSSARRRLEASDLEREKLWQETVADVLADTTASTSAAARLAADESMEVNHDRAHWRRPAQHRVVRA